MERLSAASAQGAPERISASQLFVCPSVDPNLSLSCMQALQRVQRDWAAVTPTNKLTGWGNSGIQGQSP